MYSFKSVAAAAILLAGTALPGQAASITVSTFSVSDYNTATGGLNALAVEDFEGFTLAANGAYQSASGVISTAVGDFVSVGGTGSGGTVTDPSPDTDGTKIAVRKGNVYGRTSTTDDLTGNPAADQFLDSNDTLGFKWMVNLGGTLFDTVIFVMTDSTDVGATLTVAADGATKVLSGLANGNRQLVVINFGSAVSSALITLTNNKLNDGLSIDDAFVGAQVPLPAPALLLIAGLGALGASRARRKA